MDKKYVVVKSGTSKKGNLYSMAYQLNTGKDGSEYLNQNSTYFTDDRRAVGAVLTVSQTIK